MIEIQITDGATPGLQELLDTLQPEQVLKVAGKAAETQLRQHFEERNMEGNKQGWPSKQFWKRIQRATALTDVDSEQAVVTVAEPAFNQKVYGGTITAKRGKYLALPATAAAYAAGSPRDGGGPNLTFAFSWDENRSVWRPSLVAKYNYQRRFKKGKRAGELTKARASKATAGIGTLWYWLVKSVTQDEDRRALPDNAVLDQKIGQSIEDLLDRVRERNAA